MRSTSARCDPPQHVPGHGDAQVPLRHIRGVGQHPGDEARHPGGDGDASLPLGPCPAWSGCSRLPAQAPCVRWRESEWARQGRYPRTRAAVPGWLRNPCLAFKDQPDGARAFSLAESRSSTIGAGICKDTWRRRRASVRTNGLHLAGRGTARRSPTRPDTSMSMRDTPDCAGT